GGAGVGRGVCGRRGGGGAGPPPAPPAGLVGQQVAFAGRVEATRREWFQRGTEPAADDGPAGSATGALARIVAPAAGTILALDPDIPAGRQRVPFEARDAVAGQRWLLDGAVIGAPAELLLWPAASGRHRLSLVAQDGRIVDTVSFVVRGGGSRAVVDDEPISP